VFQFFKSIQMGLFATYMCTLSLVLYIYMRPELRKATNSWGAINKSNAIPEMGVSRRIHSKA